MSFYEQVDDYFCHGDILLGQIREVFRTYAENLENIAHLMAPDLSRLLDQESQVSENTRYMYVYYTSFISFRIQILPQLLLLIHIASFLVYQYKLNQILFRV